MRINSNVPESRLEVGYPAEKELGTRSGFSCTRECASRLCTVCDTRNNTSSSVIFPHFSPSYSLTMHIPPVPFLRRCPYAASMSSVHSTLATVDRELNERILVLDVQSVHEDTVCHSKLQP